LGVTTGGITGIGAKRARELDQRLTGAIGAKLGLA
jgi:hypothetical protein